MRRLYYELSIVISYTYIIPFKFIWIVDDNNKVIDSFKDRDMQFLNGIKRTWIHLLFSIIVTAIVMSAVIAGYHYLGAETGTGTLLRICTLLGGNFAGGGYIQAFTFLAFFWSLLEMMDRIKEVNHEVRAFNNKLLPSNEKHLFIAEDIPNVHLKVSEIEKKEESCFSNLKPYKKSLHQIQSEQIDS